MALALGAHFGWPRGLCKTPPEVRTCIQMAAGNGPERPEIPHHALLGLEQLSYFFQALSVRAQVQNLWVNQSANPRPLGGLYPPFLLMVQGQGAHLGVSGIRKQVWVCSADAGVCNAWKAAGEVSSNHCKCDASTAFYTRCKGGWVDRRGALPIGLRPEYNT